ncbi:MAG TPA: hypothetical protein VHD95_09330 [Rhizomicrobium sp.]|jgi:hypothetical protein|nr:hypothetical protein [Rhizomicrobium sp.]
MITVELLAPVRLDGCVVLRAGVANHPRGNLLEMRFPARAEPLLSMDRLDHWMLAMLVPAMEQGAPLYIAGPVSERLLFSLNKQVVPLLHQFNSAWHPIKVTAAAYAPRITQSNRVAATGFSGGVDSFVTVSEYLSREVAECFRLGLLLFSSTGQFGSNIEWFEGDREKAIRSSRPFGLDLLDVATNLDSFFVTSFAYSHTIRNLSVPLAMQAGIHTFPYSSGVPYKDVSLKADDTAYIDGILIPFLSTESILFWPAGGEYTRTAKTELLAKVPESYSGLYVCLRGYEQHKKLNCSACSKCLRTMMTLDILGVLEKYKDVFDLDAFKSRQHQHVLGLSSSSINFSDDILSLAARQGVVIPWTSRALASAIRTVRDNSPAWLHWRLFKRFPRIFVS